MLNFPFYKYKNNFTLKKELREYIKKTNNESFNKFTEQNKKPNNLLFSPSFMNYRNYSDTFSNDRLSKYEIENEDYLCDFCDLNDCENNNSKTNKSNNNANNRNNNANKRTISKKNILRVISTFIGGTTIIGFTYFYYKNLFLTNK
uniref:Uncharacterized protein n=1 Tax=viral metagenome TaxID=1070528 RepID=A0A6C0JFG9_9ZZZZ